MCFAHQSACWLVRSAGAILLTALVISCCENGSYFSKSLGGCVICPEKPLLRCTYVQQPDIHLCLKNCLARAILQSDQGGFETSTTPNVENKKTTQESKRSECHSGRTTFNNFLIFVGFVAGLFVGILAPYLKR